MRFHSVTAAKYRRNGYLFVAQDFISGYYELFIQHPNGRATQVGVFTNRGVAIKEAKQRAMMDKLGFNPDIDVI